MLVTNENIFGRTPKFLEKMPNLRKFSNEKNLWQKIFSFVKYLRLFGKNKNLRNKESESLLVTTTIVCQFHEHKRLCFSEGRSTWPQSG